ncbi:MAG: SLOG family protein [Legionella sp.]|uniref:DUF2493 domain-containing protein n=1 Tax=Legionella sp. TaxID=459 RepID=UPI00283B74FB|nr:SLOG family protein [Legionella sp.]
MKVLVCGGRNFNEADFVNKTLDDLHSRTPITYLIEGGAKGADFHAGLWVFMKNYNGIIIEHKVYKAEWKKYGNAAGVIRNQHMLDMESPDLVVAFPGGVGTADMVRRAKWEKIPVIQPVKSVLDRM